MKTEEDMYVYVCMYVLSDIERIYCAYYYLLCVIMI